MVTDSALVLASPDSTLDLHRSGSITAETLQQLPLRRSSSAFARSNQPSPSSLIGIHGLPTRQQQPVNSGSSIILLDMAVCGVPPPVAVKEKRVPVVISAAPPPPEKNTSHKSPRKKAKSVDITNSGGSLVSPYLSSSPKKTKAKTTTTSAAGEENSSEDGAETARRKDVGEGEAVEGSAAAAGGPNFSATEPTTKSTKRRVRSQSLRPSNSASLTQSASNDTPSISKSLTLRPRESRPRVPLESSLRNSNNNKEQGNSGDGEQRPQRSRSMTQMASRTMQPTSSSSTDNPLTTARKQAVAESVSSGSGAAAAAALRKLTTASAVTSSLSSSTKVAPKDPGPPAIKKYVVEANAYHCTFVQSMMMSRGPEWKAAFRTAQSLTAADIAQCAFVWFKFEHIKSIPMIERVRVAPPIVELLRKRSEEMLHLWNPNEVYPDHSSNPQMAALDLLNAYLIPEEAETPNPESAPLFNIARTRMPNMVLCEKSNAHALAPPSGCDPDVAKAFDQLKSQLHYHHMKFVKGTPMIACFKEASAVWRKHLLYRYMKQYCDNDPERRGSVRERCPASFEYDLNRPEEEVKADALLFMNTLMSEHGVVRWLAKATGGANGNGFYVTKDPEDMIRYVSGQSKKAGGESDFWIIQEFVEKMPLLFDGHRFHMKVHMVMIATPVGLDFYAYKRQRIQCCSEQFNPDVMHPLSYIGNWGQQRFATNLVQEKFSTLLEDIKGEYPQLLPAWHRAKLLIAEAVEAAWRCGRIHFDFSPGCYELMGWDFVMEECPDGTWRPLLVEANHRPGFGSERKYMEKLIHEVLELVMYPINGLTKHHKDVHNGVVEAIWDHVKTIVIHPSEVPAASTTTTEAE